jgi:beta-xylosidase
LPGYNADPTGIIFGNTFYIYPTTDGIASWGATSFQAWSSTNMVDWTNRGVILNLANVSWCHANAWAPSIIQRGSTYYFYFAACGQTGVASSSSPTGPFTDLKGSALTSQIDPMVFADTDGSYYLYWGQSTMKWGKLNADMKSFSSTGTISPSGFNEGSFVFKRNGIYYFMWSQNDTRSADYLVAYATATSATGAGFTQRGTILSKNTALGILGTGHHSVFATSSGQYYIVYHRFAIPGGDGTHREVCIDLLNFNSDGTIKPVVVTLAGITSPVTP